MCIKTRELNPCECFTEPGAGDLILFLPSQSPSLFFIEELNAVWCGLLWWDARGTGGCMGQSGALAGGTVTCQDRISQRDAGARRSAAPDRSPREGLVWWLPGPSAPLRRDKSSRPAWKTGIPEAFVPGARGHAEWEIWPLLRVRLCLNPLGVSASGAAQTERSARRCSPKKSGGGGKKNDTQSSIIFL